MAAGAGLVLALGATVYPLVDAVIVPLVAFGLLLVALCSALRPDDRIAAQRVLRLCLAAFVAHVVIGAIIVNSHQLVIYLGSDAVGYDNAARQIVAHWHDSIVAMPVMGLGKEGFYYALAGLYRVLGVHPVVGVVLNGFFAAALVPLFYDLTRRFFGSAAGWWAAVIVTLQPGFLIWTSQLLREAGVLFFLAVALNCASRIASRASPWPLVILAADLTLLLTFRSDVALVAASGLAAGLIVGHRRVVGAAFVAAIVVAMVAVLIAAVGLGRRGFQLSTGASLKQVSQARSDLSATSGSGFDRNVDVSTPIRALRYLPRGLPTFLLGPFPWQLHSIRQVLGWLEALTVVVMAPFTWRGWQLAARRIGRKRLVLLLPAAALAMSLALLIGNFGAVVRERLQVLAFLTPLTALAIASRRGVPAVASEPGLGVPLPGAVGGGHDR